MGIYHRPDLLGGAKRSTPAMVQTGVPVGFVDAPTVIDAGQPGRRVL